jgi:hypothetical protein
MTAIRLFSIISWISLPTVMFGGYSLLRLLNKDGALTSFQIANFRAGHAHAGVLLVLSLVYYSYLGQTHFADGLKSALGIALVVGILAQSGGFFLHMGIGKEGKPSVGTRLTYTGALFLAIATLALAVGLIIA